MSFRKGKRRRNTANQCDIVRLFERSISKKAAHEKGMPARVNEFEKTIQAKCNLSALRVWRLFSIKSTSLVEPMVDRLFPGQ
jgi:hypothetical protein